MALLDLLKLDKGAHEILRVKEQDRLAVRADLWFAITEDAVTRGVSMLEAAEVVRAVGAEPVLLVPVVDRGGTVEAMATEAGIPLRALVTAPDLGFPYERDVA